MKAPKRRLTKDGRIVVYSGDDERFEHVYQFVSDGRFDPGIAQPIAICWTRHALRRANSTRRLGEWLRTGAWTGPLTAANGFNDQGDVVIEARRAAELLGATPMDRPEDIEPIR